jgi:hypothetical protein
MHSMSDCRPSRPRTNRQMIAALPSVRIVPGRNPSGRGLLARATPAASPRLPHINLPAAAADRPFVPIERF